MVVVMVMVHHTVLLCFQFKPAAYVRALVPNSVTDVLFDPRRKLSRTLIDLTAARMKACCLTPHNFIL